MLVVEFVFGDAICLFFEVSALLVLFVAVNLAVFVLFVGFGFAAFGVGDETGGFVKGTMVEFAVETVEEIGVIDGVASFSLALLAGVGWFVAGDPGVTAAGETTNMLFRFSLAQTSCISASRDLIDLTV